MAAPAYVTPEDYLRFERAAKNGKSEYVDGHVFAMSGVSRFHARIGMNLSTAIDTRLRKSPCEAFSSDVRVRTSATGIYTYPDLSIVCGEPIWEDDDVDTLLNPVVIVEILSLSTESYDRGEKFRRYREIESLREYVLISQSLPLVEVFERTDRGWLLRVDSESSTELRLRSIELTVPISEVYDRVATDQVNAVT